MNDLIFYPPAVTHNKQYYRFITCGFIHADFMHLAFNMFSFYLFGQMVERQFETIFGNGGKDTLSGDVSAGAGRVPCYLRTSKTKTTRITGALAHQERYLQLFLRV